MPRFGTGDPTKDPCCCPNDDIVAELNESQVILQQIEDNTDGLEGFTDGIEASLTALQGYVDGIEGLLTTINTNVDGLEGFVDGLEALATTLNGLVDGLEGSVDGLETKLDTIITNTAKPTILYAANVVSVDTAIIASPGVGLKLYITSIAIQNATANAQTIILKETTTGNVVFTVTAVSQGNGLGQEFSKDTAIPLTADNGLTLDVSAAFNVNYTIAYYIAA